MFRTWHITGATKDVILVTGRGQAPDGAQPLTPELASWHLTSWVEDGAARPVLHDIGNHLASFRPSPAHPDSDEVLQRIVRQALFNGSLRAFLWAPKQGGGPPPPPPVPPPPPPPPPAPVTVTADIVEDKVCVLAQRPARALDFATVHADFTPPGGSAVWTGSDATVARVVGAGATCSISGLDPGAIDVTVTYTYAGQSASDTVRCVVYRAEIDNPTGDPVNAPAATNEFEFSAATPGVLTIPCRAKITPATAEARACAEPHLRWTIDGVGNSALAWDHADPANAARGAGIEATATFTGLPEHNADFGPKTVSLLVDGIGGAVATTTIEVFWPKNARNHPNMPGVPNWFFYWTQVVTIPAGVHLFYTNVATGNFAETRGMLNWGYAATPPKTHIQVMDIAALRDGAIAGLHGPLTGIDLFANTVLHESRHVRQIRDADAVVGIHPGTCWRFGWSWNAANHNHWAVGPDGQPGRAGVDDDGDGTVDNQILLGPGEMGAAGSDDVLLNDPAVRDWPTAFGAVPAGAAPAGAFIGGHPIEQQAFQAETSPEHHFARQDWGAPGKNHRTLNRFDD